MSTKTSIEWTDVCAGIVFGWQAVGVILLVVGFLWFIAEIL